MQEFSTVTASSYDAEALAPLLTEKAAEGWDVVSIVAAGTNIVAYMRRDAGTTSAPAGDTSAAAADETAAVTPEASSPESTIASTAGAAPLLPDVHSAAEVAAEADDASNNDTPYVPAESAITADEPAVASTPDSGGDAAAAGAAAAADEPAGWAAAPDNDIADLAAQVGADDTAASAGDLGAGAAGVVGAAGAAGAATLDTAGDTVGGLADSTTDAAGGMADQAAAGAGDTTDSANDAATGAVDQATDAGAGAATADSGVPAGWYADPSGRYELRYWDGTAWTEHVSRAGQQFTDPPVA